MVRLSSLQGRQYVGECRSHNRFGQSTVFSPYKAIAFLYKELKEEELLREWIFQRAANVSMANDIRAELMKLAEMSGDVQGKRELQRQYDEAYKEAMRLSKRSESNP